MDRVEQKDDHVLVYLEAVSWIHRRMMLHHAFEMPHSVLCFQLVKDFAVHHSLDLIQEVPVKNLKPAVVNIYDYYQTGKILSLIQRSDPRVLGGL